MPHASCFLLPIPKTPETLGPTTPKTDDPKGRKIPHAHRSWGLSRREDGAQGDAHHI